MALRSSPRLQSGLLAAEDWKEGLLPAVPSWTNQRNRPGKGVAMILDRPAEAVAQTSANAYSRRFEGFILGAAVLVGAAIRLQYVLASNFPLNDGGLFYVMIQAIQAAHYALPSYVSYGGLQIPLTYPPLGFYVAAIISDLAHLSTLAVLHYVPVVVSILTIPAFYLVARAFLKSRTTAVFALFIFSVLPFSFMWHIMGGGITRAFGFLFAVLAVHQLFLLYNQPRNRNVVLASVFSSLTILSHPVEAVFVVLSAIALLIWYGRNREALRNSLFVGLGTAIIIAPWLGTMILWHGIGPFINAFSAGSNPVGTLLAIPFDFELVTGEPFFPVLATLALLGILICWRDKQFFLPCWLLIICLFDSRASLNDATVPLAMLAALAVSDLLLPLLTRRGAIILIPDHARENVTPNSARRFALSVPAMVLGGLLFYAMVGATTTGKDTLGSLTATDRAAMQWVANNSPTSSRFLIVTGHGWDSGGGPGIGQDRFHGWADDRVSEWFPALADRHSVMTIQGTEWTANFAQSQKEYAKLQDCGESDGACLDTWSTKYGRPFDYVYLPKTAEGQEPGGNDGKCCAALRNALRQDPGFQTVYDGAGGTIFARRPN